MEKLVTIVAAAGSGERLRANMNKMYVDIAGQPLIVRTLAALAACPSCVDVVVAVAPGEIDRAEQLLTAWQAEFARLKWTVTAGGLTRQESVSLAFETVPEDCAFVAVHDGARPFISREVFERVFAAAREKMAAIAAVHVHDTVKMVRNNLIESTLDREHVLFAQTPQIFSREIFAAACAKAGKDGFSGTDDASLVENLGYRVAVTEGDPANIKITTPVDVFLAQKYLADKA